MVSKAANQPQAIAGIMLYTFGSCWLIAALLPTLIPGAERFVGMVFPVGGGLCWAFMHRISKNPSPYSTDGVEVQRLYRRIMWDSFMLELVLIPALVVVMVSKGLGEIIPSMVAIAIGVHFLPMGGAFRLPLYYILGVLLVAVGVYGAVAVPGSQWIVGALTGTLLIIAGGLIGRRVSGAA